MLIKIGGIQKTSFIDYPGKIAAVIFTSGCNFSCGYCHNGGLFESGNCIYSPQNIMDYLKSRYNKLDAVVISGGEPTLHRDLFAFVSKVKELGFLVKLDTNGTNPDVVDKMVRNELIDYFAMDIKAPLDRYPEIVNANVNIDNIVKSVDIIKNSGVDYEFRTTVVKNQLGFEDFKKIGEMLKGSRLYYLQRFKNESTLNPLFSNYTTYSDDDFSKIVNLLSENIVSVKLR